MKSKGYSPHQGLGAHPQKGEHPPQEGSSLRRGAGGRQPPLVKVLKKVLVVILSLSVFFALAVSASAYIGYNSYALPFNVEINYSIVDSGGNVNVFDTVSSIVFGSEGYFSSYTIESDFLNIEVYEQSSGVYDLSSYIYADFDTMPSDVAFSGSVHFGSTYFKSGVDFQDYIEVVYNDTTFSVLSISQEDFVPFPVVVAYSFWSEDTHQFVNGTYNYMVTYDYLVSSYGDVYLADVVQNALVFGIGGQAGFYLDESPLIISSIHCDLPGYYYNDGTTVDIAVGDVQLFNDSTMVSSSEFFGSSMLYAYDLGFNETVDLQGVGGLLSSAVGGFLDTPIFWRISLGDIMFTIIGICLVCMFLKFFAGG